MRRAPPDRVRDFDETDFSGDEPHVTSHPERQPHCHPERQPHCHPERQRGISCASLVAHHERRTEDPSLTLGMTTG